MPSRCARPKIGAALAVRVGVHRVGLQERAVLGHEVEDGVALVGAAGQEAREQRDVGVGDQVVADPAVAAVADVVGGLQALRDARPTSCRRRRRVSPLPQCRCRPTPGVGVDHARDRLVQARLGDVALVDEGDVPAVEALQRARGLARPEAAAVAEGGGEIALARAVELGLEARDRAEVPGPAEPVLGVGQRLQDADRDACAP